MTPFFSVVIPLYNKEKYIEDTLKSVMNQTFKDFEIIIVNDGSTDESLKVISQFKNEKTHVYSQGNQGVATARNNGVNYSSGLYIALMDADDVWYKNHLEELKKQIDLFPNAGLFCNNYEIKLQDTVIRKTKFNFPYKENCIIKDYFKGSIIDSIAWTSAIAFSKQNFTKIGGFNPIYTTSQDIDLWIKFALNFNISFNPNVTACYNQYSQDSLSQSKQNNIRALCISQFKKEESKNSSLKLYLDINRYAVALRCKIHHDIQLYKTLKSEINFENLNLKQKLLLHCPTSLLILFKKTQHFLVKRNIYLSAYK